MSVFCSVEITNREFLICSDQKIKIELEILCDLIVKIEKSIGDKDSAAARAMRGSAIDIVGSDCAKHML